MKYFLALSLLLLTGGCATRTLSADDFLYAYRCGALPDELAANCSATYTGRDETFHYLELRSGRPADEFLGDLSGMRKVRCRVDLLPSSFPSGFETFKNVESVENAEDTRQYVQNYLSRHRNDRAEDRPATGRQSPRRTHRNNDDPGPN